MRFPIPWIQLGFMSLILLSGCIHKQPVILGKLDGAWYSKDDPEPLNLQFRIKGDLLVISSGQLIPMESKIVSITDKKITLDPDSGITEITVIDDSNMSIKLGATDLSFPEGFDGHIYLTKKPNLTAEKGE